MSYFTKLTATEIAFLLFQVAELRVTGKSWETIAQELMIPVLELRKFLFERGSELTLQIRKARREHREFCVDEAVNKLRQQCQSSNEKIRQSAACNILRLQMAELRYRENLRKAKLKKSLPSQKKISSLPATRNESPTKIEPIRNLSVSKFSAPQSLDFSQLPSQIQQQTTEMAKLLQVKI
jgi:hypothetical protein